MTFRRDEFDTPLTGAAKFVPGARVLTLKRQHGGHGRVIHVDPTGWVLVAMDDGWTLRFHPKELELVV